MSSFKKLADLRERIEELQRLYNETGNVEYLEKIEELEEEFEFLWEECQWLLGKAPQPW